MSGENQGTEIVGESKESSSNPEVARQKIEARATKDGWAPLDQWKGPEEDWIDAKEFLGRQKLFDRIDGLKKTLKGQKEEYERDFKVIATEMANMSEVAYKRAISELKAQRAMAIEDKDIEAIDELDDQIKDTQKKLDSTQENVKQVNQKRPQQESEGFTTWKKENPWFENNSEMQEDAIAIGVGYGAKNPNKTEEDVYKYVSDRIKKMYPDQFERQSSKEQDEEGDEPSTQRSTKKVSTVETGGVARPNTSRKNKLSTNDLDEQTRSVMKTLIKRGVFKDAAAKAKMTEEEYYLEQYAANPSQTRK